jgi:myo-inositol-1(or 4)-monophosphatase
MIDLDTIERVALEAHRQGGRVLRRYFRRLETIEHKGEDYANLITVADRKSEDTIMATIREHFPDHDILAEETGENEAAGDGPDIRWIIDPLDGTTNYSHGLPVYSISIAVEVEGEVLYGSVSNPQLKELFTARKGGGAFHNGKPIHVSSNDSLKTSLIITGFPYDRRERADRYLAFWRAIMMRSHGLRRMGSAALDMSYVAAGVFEAYYEESLNPWDWAAGDLIVREAGGRVTDFAGAPFQIDMNQCVASNGLVHDEMLAILGGDLR